MDIAVNQIEYKSANLKNTIRGYLYAPAGGSIKGIVQLSHGMREYITRYDGFMRYLVEQGFVVCGNDHIGHGKSVEQKSQLGYFSPSGAKEHLVEDLYTLTKLVKKQYPDVPYFLMGHSMGSFIARLYAARHGKELQGLILSGTGGKIPMVGAGVAIAKTITKLEGEEKTSKLITKMMFGDYNKKIVPLRTGSDWITRDTNIVDAYRKDPLSNFPFTNNGLVTVMELSKEANEKKTFAKTPKNLPIYLIAGDMDPVGDYGVGVRGVFASYLDAGLSDVEIQLYEGARHEVINEINRDDVYLDITNWLIGQASR